MNVVQLSCPDPAIAIPDLTDLPRFLPRIPVVDRYEERYSKILRNHGAYNWIKADAIAAGGEF